MGKTKQLEDVLGVNAPIFEIRDGRYIEDLDRDTYRMLKACQQRCYGMLSEPVYQAECSRYRVKYGIDDSTQFRNMYRMHEYLKTGGTK